MPKAGHLFDAALTSPTSPGGTPVRVRFDARGLVIEDPVGETAIWPYAGIGTTTRLPRKGDMRISLVSPVAPGSILAAGDPEFIASIIQAAPKLRRASVGPGWLPMVWASLAVVALIGGLISALAGLLPYKAIARRIPEDARIQIGEATLADITSEHKRCRTPAGDAALTRLTDRLSRASGTGIAFKVQVVDWKLLNAFTVMGNQIVLTKEILRAAASADEVAGVLGHEMGHAIELHAETGALRGLGTMLGIQVLLGGWTPDVVTLAASQLLLLRHGRANELEADDVALRLLQAAGISAKPFGGFFDKMIKDEEQAGAKGLKVPDLFSTHPPSPERARRVKAGPDYPSTPALNAAEWEALRKICG